MRKEGKEEMEGADEQAGVAVSAAESGGRGLTRWRKEKRATP